MGPPEEGTDSGGAPRLCARATRNTRKKSVNPVFRYYRPSLSFLTKIVLAFLFPHLSSWSFFFFYNVGFFDCRPPKPDSK